MIRAARIAAAAALVSAAATQSFAGNMLYMSDPGLCDAGDGVTELMDTTFLSERSVGNHYFECTWKKDLGRLLKRRSPVEMKVSCMNDTESWTQVMRFSMHDETGIDYDVKYPRYISVRLDPRGTLAAQFYPCRD
ncbi:hypothetical protein RXV86_14485 [Alisedimentitalea sp. MJ-SS2]|uniref:hypothetical protein n=1 Tax=Aliisedimentitalea sp. MJ-SS2 TaxID=3049795 RepID=UPI00290E9CAA|nr:hypothetical protein [Alisedimentitalea sp. MJ-SS2]MDU8928596.1 hypothetical protein [Alisedimentitalea sp. MJ-SS2]